jgi:hypothetical protein
VVLYLQVFQPKYCTHSSSLPLVIQAPLIPSTLIWSLLIIFSKAYKLCSSSLCSLLQPPLMFYLFRPDILLSILFSNVVNLCSFNVTGQVSQPYKTTGKIIVSYAREEMGRQETLEQNGSKNSPYLICCYFSWVQVWFVTVVPKHWNLPHSQRIYYQSVNYNFVLHFGDETQPYSLLCIYIYTNLPTRAVIAQSV